MSSFAVNCPWLFMGIPGRPHPLIWVCTIVIFGNESKIAKTCICDSICWGVCKPPSNKVGYGGWSVPVMCLQTQRLAQLFNHKEGFPAVKVTNLINSKILIGHTMVRPMGQSTALLDNTQSSVLRLFNTIYKNVMCKIWLSEPFKYNYIYLF